MTLIPWAEWRPDVAGLNSAFTADLANVLSAAGGKLPFPSLEELTSALPAAPTGGFTVRADDGSVYIFAGTATALYLLDNTDFTWTPVSETGADQATNGGFGADTNWTKGSGWTITGGQAVATTVADGVDIDQSQSLTAGTIYKVVYTVSNFSAGGVRPIFEGGSQVNGTTVTANGTYTDYLTAVTGNNIFGFEAVGTTTLRLDNVTLTPMTVYASTADERWRFAVFGEYVVAVNINDAPQVYQIGTSTEFDDLAGSPPNARCVAVWEDVLALADDDTVYWSEHDDIETWNILWAQTFYDGGKIQFISSSTNPFVIQKRAIRAGTYNAGANNPGLFSFTKVQEARGAAATYSCCQRGPYIFYADSGGFYQLDSSGQCLPIGKEKVDRTIFGAITGDNLATIYGEVDPFYPRVYFAVNFEADTETAFDRLIIYDWEIQEWTQIEVEMDILFPLSAGTIGLTLEGLDSISASIEDLPYSLDSQAYQGGAPIMAAFTGTYELGFFQGDNAEARIVTQEMGDTATGMTFTSGATPVVDADTVYVSPGSRGRRGVAITWGSETLVNPETGTADFMLEARYQTYKLRIPAATSWRYAQGIDVAASSSGGR